MKLLIVLALFAVIAYALPVDEVAKNEETEEAPLTIADLESENEDGVESDVDRVKRQYGGYGNRGGHGGYGQKHGGHGGYGGHRGHHHQHHHRPRGNKHWGK